VFAESKRKVTPLEAAELCKNLHSDIIPVGVFVNETIENILAADSIEVIQLHGSESEDYIRELKRKTNKPVIKAGNSQEADFLLFDGPVPGSGQTFDRAEIPKTEKPFFLAGGLTPENVSEAIKKTAPFAVDVSSGVETNGVKDAEKIKNFIRSIKNGK
jgi:phosphoribosylanthranilate isomerase